MHAYADDSQLYIAFKPEPEHAANAVTAMQACITDIRFWYMFCNLGGELFVSKCVICIRNKLSFSDN